MEVSVECGCGSVRAKRLPLAARWLYGLARRCRRHSAVHQAGDLARTTDESAYRAWRERELRQQLTDHFDVSRLRGLDVLDFGCGTGELSGILSQSGPRSVVGVDASADAVNRAVARQPQADGGGGVPVRFEWSEASERIPLDAASVDLVCCFDVVEHIPNMAAIASEWHRVLRPGGRVWIWWSPWRGPFGHHLESLIPIPWVHLLFSENAIFRACAELYDDPDYVPRKWDQDSVTGRKKPNKWRTTTSFHPFLNRLSGRRFDRLVAEASLRVQRREVHGFGGSWLRRATRAMLPMPLVGECFTSYYIYELAKAP